MALDRPPIAAEIRATLAVAAPLAAANLAQMAMQVTNAVMVGHLGAIPLAAAGLGNALNATLLMTSQGLLTAVAPLAAQSIGAGDHPARRCIFPTKAGRLCPWALGKYGGTQRRRSVYSRSVGPGSCPAASSIERGDLVQPINDLFVGHCGCVAASPFRFLAEKRGIGGDRGVRRRFIHVDLTLDPQRAIQSFARANK
jgi:hypothetical protein